MGRKNYGLRVWLIRAIWSQDRELPLVWINQEFTGFIRRWLGWSYMKMDQAASRYQVVSLNHASLYKSIKYAMLFNRRSCWWLLSFNRSLRDFRITSSPRQSARQFTHTGGVFAFTSAKRSSTEWTRLQSWTNVTLIISHKFNAGSRTGPVWTSLTQLEIWCSGYIP